MILEVSGEGTERAFEYESGGHRWQRVPPNEKHGRRHTSTVTVSVMPTYFGIEDSVLKDSDIDWWAVRGSGAGGQARNKTSNCVMMKHKPTNTLVRVETSRSQWENRQAARRLLAAKLTDVVLDELLGEQNRRRKLQVGEGKRGDKIRTIRMQDNRVKDHRTGKSMPADVYLRGEIGGLH